MGGKNFKVFFPNEEVNVNQRFFFFNSLKNKNNDETPQLVNQVLGILNTGESLFNQSDNDSEGLTLIEQALAFLKNTINFERAQEIDYFKEHILNNPNIPEELSKQFENCYTITNESLEIDYINFINVINKFYLGSEEYKDNLKYETDRLNELNKIINEFYNLSKKRKEIYRKAARDKAREKAKKDSKANADYIDGEFFQESFRSFLLDKFAKYEKGPHQGEYINLLEERDKADWALNTQTRANKIQNYLASTFSEIWNNTDLINYLKNIILNEDASLNNLKQQTIAFLVTNFCNVSAREIIKIIEEEENKTDRIVPIKQSVKKRLAEEFAASIGFKDGNTTTTIISENQLLQKQLQNLINRASIIENEAQQSEKIKKRMFRGINPDKIIGHMKGEEGRNTRGGLEGLSQNVLEALKLVLQEELGDKYQTKHEKDNKITLRKEILDNLLNSLDENSGVIIKATNTRHNKGVNYHKLAEIIRHKLEGTLQFEIKKKDNLGSELLGENGPLASSKWGSKFIATALTDGFQKSDSSFFDLGQYKISNTINDNTWEDISKTIIDSYTNSNSRVTFDVILSSEEKEKRLNQGFSTTEFFIEGETDRKLADIEKRYNTVQTELKEAGASTEEIQQALEVLKNSFQISTTVKSYDKYNDKIGFYGGSLGGSLETQIANILKMFEYGGISDIDKDWLLFAIYNSSKRTLGSEYKNKVEDLLSTVAVMLLFDDAGQQAIYIQEQLEDRNFQPPTKFLHLYFLNGSYFPASFILSLTYNGLIKGKQLLDSSARITSNGSRANIINNVNESNIIGGKKDKTTGGRIVTTSPQNWIDTFSGNAQNVKIELTFLAGLLDIMDKLNTAMAQPFN